MPISPEIEAQAKVVALAKKSIMETQSQLADAKTAVMKLPMVLKEAEASYEIERSKLEDLLVNASWE